MEENTKFVIDGENMLGCITAASWERERLCKTFSPSFYSLQWRFLLYLTKKTNMYKTNQTILSDVSNYIHFK